MKLSNNHLFICIFLSFFTLFPAFAQDQKEETSQKDTTKIPDPIRSGGYLGPYQFNYISYERIANVLQIDSCTSICFEMVIPSGYSITRITSGTDLDDCILFHYPDGSYIFVSNGWSPNIKEILARYSYPEIAIPITNNTSGYYLSDDTEEKIDGIIGNPMPDSLFFKGFTVVSKCWSEKEFKDYCVGYKNVSIWKRKVFDMAISSFHRLDKDSTEKFTLIGKVTVLYYVTNHRGSTRVVKDGSGIVRQRYDYYPYGTVSNAWTSSSITDSSEKRYRFGGKEIAGVALSPLSAGSDAYLDFGARLYSPRSVVWLSLDPMAEKYYSYTPYAYCAEILSRNQPQGS